MTVEEGFWLLECEQNSDGPFLVAGGLFGLPFNPEEGGITFLRHVGKLKTDYTASHARRSQWPL
jgi:hypothetical protein